MMRRLRHILAILGLAGGLLVGSATTAGAGAGASWTVTSSLTGYVDTLVLGFANEGAPCDGSGTTVNFLDLDDVQIGQAPLSGANEGTVVVPDDLSESFFQVTITCSAGTSGLDGTFDYAGLDVTKAVEGDVPADAEFVIEVDCESGVGALPDAGPYDLVFGADGGTNRVWFSTVHLCELTETDDGGAQSTTIVSEDCDGGPIGPAESRGSVEADGEVSSYGEGPTVGNGAELVAINGPVRCDATVTNTFADTTTTTDSTTTTTTTTTTAPDDGVSPSTASPATPTQAQPTFTG